MRIAIRVKPGSARPGVGGEHDGALVVRVSARAVDGKATEAALAAVAASFGVRRSAVRLVSGASSRTKIVDIDAGDPRILAALLAAPGRLRPQQDAAAVAGGQPHAGMAGDVSQAEIGQQRGESGRSRSAPGPARPRGRCPVARSMVSMTSAR